MFLQKYKDTSFNVCQILQKKNVHIIFLSGMSGGLKADLDNYLNNGTKSSTFSNLTKNLAIPASFKSPFFSSSAEDKKSGEDEEALLSDADNSWYPNSSQKDCFPSLSKKQRIFGFITCLALGLLFFSMASIYIPILLLKARKFSLLFSLGSVFTMGSFSFLWGPCSHLKHLLAKERLPFTTVYLGSLLATLYFALVMQSTIFTSAAAVFQVGALLWFVISYIPGGQTGLKFFTRICSSMCKKGSGSVLPI